MKKVLIAGAWVYANGSLHIGHLASLLPGDVLARYHRAIGNDVYYVSGSDCYGTPVTISSKKEGKSPAYISDFYHEEFCKAFTAMGFSYDYYTKTTAQPHIDFVREFHRRMYEGNYIEERTVTGARCPVCEKVLTDRMMVGICPKCGQKARGDQCDVCGEILEADQLVDATCADCGSRISFGETTQLFLRITHLEQELRSLLEAHPQWRKNAQAFTKRYIDEGLRDRAITRDLDWGIDVPKTGYENKKIYIWAENVLGYLSASACACQERGTDFDQLWGEGALHYYVHGKDNIPFHTIILPSLLLAHGAGYRLPDSIISSEHLTLEGRKISTSQNWAIWVKDIVAKYNPDAIRYFFIADGPERHDGDFSYAALAERNNNELLGGWGNLVNRTLVFIHKYQGGTIPTGSFESEIADEIRQTFSEVGKAIAAGNFREGIERAFALVRYGNRYYDGQKPWETRQTDEGKCAHTIYNCVQIIGNLGVILQPFLPFSSEKVLRWLDFQTEWKLQTIQNGHKLPEISVLFERIDINQRYVNCSTSH
jgi:methionyl-tRNA synthetase